MSAVQRNPQDGRQGLKSGASFAAAFQYTADPVRTHTTTNTSAAMQNHGLSTLSPRRRAAQAAGMYGYNASTDLPPPLYVRALYDYESDDPTSLSFRQGDIIQVLTQLESGWWDGVINDVRGWFPSNYCTVINDLDDIGVTDSQDDSEASIESGTEEEDYDEDGDGDGDSDLHTGDEDELPGGRPGQVQEEAAYWIPQATPDGRLFFFNTLTGVSTMELPLETPSSPTDSGPRNGNNFHVPDQTRPPPEMMAGGYQHEEEYDGSASEADIGKPRKTLPPTRGRKNSHSSSTPNTSMNTSISRGPSASLSQANISIAPLGTTATSFSAVPRNDFPVTGAPKYFVDDGALPAVNWEILVDNMRASIESYREAVKAGNRSEYVRRAEDISDHLRMLLAAGSGTTDNHSGNPSIISTNKALYPHFREMMSKFSKLVLSSHIAAADWPGPEAGSKCLQEADGVLHGVFGFVEVARQQRGEEIPRLTPGFVAGAHSGGHWRDNNIDNQFVRDGNAFADSIEDQLKPRPSVPLDALSLRGIEEARISLLSAVRRLEDRLSIQEKILTPIRQQEISDTICLAAGSVLDHFRPWVSLIESIDLAPIGSVFQKPSLLDIGSQKQKVYDSIGDLVAACQATSAPLHDEWAELRNDYMEKRLSNVQAICKQLDNHVAQVNYSLQLLEPATNNGNTPVSSTNKREHRMTDGGETYQNAVLRAEPNHAANRPNMLGEIGHSQSYSLGQGLPESNLRKAQKDKAQRFFGQVPPTLSVQTGGLSPSIGSPEDVPWYLELEHSREIVYDPKTDPPQVKSGTLMGLVEQLTRHDRPDTIFNTTFLLTYRSFISAAELFQLLVQRFNIQPPQGLDKDEMQLWEENKQKPVRFRVVNILKQWLEQYWMESNDADSQQLLERINAFARGTIMDSKIPLAGPLVTVIDQRTKGQDTSAKKLVLTLTGSAPPPLLPKNMKKIKFLDIDATEFARQLTIAESRLYGKIKPVECLERIWEKKDKTGNHDRAPNIQALILHSNQLTNWVAEMILSYGEVRKRVAVIKHFITIADRCRSLNNFSTLTAIVSALGTAPILRLNRTWNQVNQKTKDSLETMRTLITSTKNFARYREALHAANPPCIPFLGVYLTDLTFIEDGIASIVKNTELINFHKRHKTADVIRDIQQYQNVPYTLQPVTELQEWILENMRIAGDVHEMYNRSLDIEPREREEEKIARLLSESGFL